MTLKRIGKLVFIGVTAGTIAQVPLLAAFVIGWLLWDVFNEAR